MGIALTFFLGCTIQVGKIHESGHARSHILINPPPPQKTKQKNKQTNKQKHARTPNKHATPPPPPTPGSFFGLLSLLPRAGSKKGGGGHSRPGLLLLSLLVIHQHLPKLPDPSISEVRFRALGTRAFRALKDGVLLE